MHRSLLFLISPDFLSVLSVPLATCIGKNFQADWFQQKSAITGLGATGCKITDLTCICKAPAFIQAVGTQIAASCTPDDQKKAVAFANSICQPLGVTIPSEGLDTTASETAPSATEAKEVPSATEVATPEATETGVEPPVSRYGVF